MSSDGETKPRLIATGEPLLTIIIGIKMDSKLIDPKAIAQTCSRKHIQSVIENLVDIIKAQEHLADKVLFLNPRCGEIGEGMLTHLQSLAYDIVNKQHHKV